MLSALFAVPGSSFAQNKALPQHWSFIRPVKSPQPEVDLAAWLENPIDSFVLAIAALTNTGDGFLHLNNVDLIDNSNLPSKANLIDDKPMHTPTKVKIFGRITLEFLFDTNLIFLLGCSI